MTEKSGPDGLLYEACRENRDTFLAYGPDFAKIEQEALLQFGKRRAARRRKIVLRVAAAAAALIVLVNGFVFFVDIGPVKAYRNGLRSLYFNLVNPDAETGTEMQILNTSKEIRNAQKTVPYQIPFPHWLPEGFVLDSVKVKYDGQNEHQVIMKYNSPTAEMGELLQINVQNEPAIAGTLPSDGENAYEKETIAGVEAYTQANTTDGITRLTCFYFNEDGLLIRISGAIDKQALAHMIKEMKP